MPPRCAVMDTYAQPQADPHPVDEDPEQHLGEVVPDPWDDPEQTDWPGGEVATDGVDGGA